MTNLNSIHNFIQISENLGTSGQPNPEAFQDIAQAGYQVVINLAPSDANRSLPNEGEIVAANGMQYVHIPVIWNNPKLEDWETFAKTMAAHQDKKVFVHCQANMRVSAFVMLYRHIKLGLDLATARQPILPMWKPEQDNTVWACFIEEVIHKEKA